MSINIPVPFQTRPVHWENSFANSNNIVIPGYQTSPGANGIPWYAQATDVFRSRGSPGYGGDPRDIHYRTNFTSRREYIPLYGNRSKCFSLQRYNNGFGISTRAVRTPCPWEISTRF
jgi:hypothetical protein